MGKRHDQDVKVNEAESRSTKQGAEERALDDKLKIKQDQRDADRKELDEIKEQIAATKKNNEEYVKKKEDGTEEIARLK